MKRLISLCLLILFLVLVSTVSSEPIELVNLKAHTKLYVAAEDGGSRELIANRESPSDWEAFELIYLGDDKVALKTSAGYYITAESGGGGEVTATRLSGEFPVDEWEIFELIKLEDNLVAFRTHNGHYLTADSMNNELVVANRTIIDTWEKFEIVNIVAVDSTDYNVETFGQIGRNVLVRATASNNYIWAGEYSLRRPGGYEHLDNRARLWYTQDGKTWYEGGSVYGYESINSINATKDGKGINFGTEQGPEIFSAYESAPRNLIFRFRPKDDRYDFLLAIDDAGKFGELATVNAPYADPQTRLAGFFDGIWQWAPYPSINFDFVGWDLLEWYDWLLVGGSGSWPGWEQGQGQIVGYKKGWSEWIEVLKPEGAGKGCLTLTKVDNTLIASFAKEIWWTRDPELKVWHKSTVPGYWNWNWIQTGPETVIGLWHSSDRWPSSYGNGVWLVEFNFISGSIKIIHKWEVNGNNKELPFYVGGDLAKIGDSVIGFFSSGGKSYGIKITW